MDNLPGISQDLGNGSRDCSEGLWLLLQHLHPLTYPLVIWQCARQRLSNTRKGALTISARRLVFPSDHRAGQVLSEDMDVYRGRYLTMTTSEVPLHATQAKVKWEQPAFLSQVLAPPKECRL